MEFAFSSSVTRVFAFCSSVTRTRLSKLYQCPYVKNLALPWVVAFLLHVQLLQKGDSAITAAGATEELEEAQALHLLFLSLNGSWPIDQSLEKWRPTEVTF
jgi:hypothetical protein